MPPSELLDDGLAGDHLVTSISALPMEMPCFKPDWPRTGARYAGP